MHAMQVKCLAGFLLCLCVLSCRYDDDSQIVPGTKMGFLLVQSASGEHTLVRDQDGILTPGWNQELGINSIGLSDIAGYDDRLWVTSGEERKVYEYAPEKEELVATYSTGDFQPHSACAGDAFLLLTDSVSSQLGFMKKANGKLTVVSAPGTPGRAVYRGGKFYLILDQHQVGIYDEFAFAPLVILDFAYPVVDLQIDKEISIFAFTKDTVVFRSRINYIDNSLIGKEIPQPYQKIRLSPIKRLTVGTEWLDDIFLQDGELNVGVPVVADDFEVDFFTANLYVLASDSLKMINLREPNMQSAIPFEGKMQKAWFFRDFIEK